MKKQLIFCSFLVLGGFMKLEAQSVSYDQNNTPVYPLVAGDNCGFGFGALNNTGLGPGNTATGKEALTANYTGEFNTAYGKQALFSNYNGSQNVGVGFQALYNNACFSCTGGHQNTALGRHALYTNTDGSENSANGPDALYSNITGAYNSALGWGALYSNNSTSALGNNNSAAGHQALYSCDNCEENTAIGSRAMYNYVNAKHCTAFGYGAGGFGGTMFGTIDDNTMIGLKAMANAAGDQNTALGVNALYNNSGTNETVVGLNALYTNNVGVNNVAVGREALYDNPHAGGLENTAVGLGALRNNSSGSLLSPGRNTAFGGNMVNCYGGQQNTAAGTGALGYSGASVKYNCNTILGPWSDITSIYGNASTIGYNAYVNANNKMRVGDINVTTVETQVGYVPISDGRFKYNLSEKDVKGIEFIKRLRPVTYNFDTKKFTEFLTQSMPDSLKKKAFDKNFEKSTSVIRSGFIAQEMEKAARESDFNFNAVHAPADENDNYSVAYDLVVVPLVKAIQEQQQLLEQQRSANKKIRQEISEGKRYIDELGKQSQLMPSPISDFETGYHLEFSIDESTRDCRVTCAAPGNTGEAVYLALYNAAGKQIKSVLLNQQQLSAQVRITIEKECNDLAICSIISNGKVMATKTIGARLQ